MTSRQRVTAAIEFGSPDMLPLRHATLPAAWRALPGLPQLYAKHPSDFAGEDGLPPARLPRCFQAGSYVDDWGCTWTVAHEGLLGQVTGFPLADPADWDRYQPPPVAAAVSPPGGDSLPAGAERYRCSGWITTFERLINLCGFNTLLMAVYDRHPALPGLIEKVAAHNLQRVRDLLAAGTDGIFFADDWGTQTTPMVAPATWRELFLPVYRRLFAAARSGGAHVFFHSDGVVAPLLPDLLEAGAQVFWVDLTINPSSALAELRGRACFQLLTDVQFTLRTGRPAEVRRHVRRLVNLLATPHGGVILCHEVGPDQPWPNIEACLDEFDHARRRGEHRGERTPGAAGARH